MKHVNIQFGHTFNFTKNEMHIYIFLIMKFKVSLHF